MQFGFFFGYKLFTRTGWGYLTVLRSMRTGSERTTLLEFFDTPPRPPSKKKKGICGSVVKYETGGYKRNPSTTGLKRSASRLDSLLPSVVDCKRGAARAQTGFAFLSQLG